MYRLATVHRVTDRRTARQTDNVIMLIADHAAQSVGSAKKGKERTDTEGHMWAIFEQYGEQTSSDRFTPQVARL